MKHIKRIASALLSVTMLASSLATGTFGGQLTASAKNYPKKLSTIMSEWSGRLYNEQQKFPPNKYWNDYNAKNNKNYSLTPCNHSRDGKAHCNTMYMMNPMNQNHARIQYDRFDSSVYCSQCAGFTRQLAVDMWGTSSFIRYNLEKNGSTKGYINYNYGGKKRYEPMVGDQVRLFSDTTGKQGHSIFITGISGEQIIFADCNADLNDCKIQWGRKSTKNYETNTTQTVNKAFLRNNAVYIERPIIQGDLNLNGKIDSNDKTLFQQSYIETGNTISLASFMEYDINGDLRVGEEDMREMDTYINKSSADGYIYCTGDSIEFRDRISVPSNGFRRNDGVYKKIDSTTASFIGPFSAYTSTFTVPSTAYNASEGKTYTITGIGESGQREPGGYLKNLTNITIPSTVKTIYRFAFSSTKADVKLQNITFSGTPGLTTIGNDAFMNCYQLNTLDLGKCNKLTSIGSSAFSLCPNLHVIMPYVSSGSSQPTPQLGSGSYGSFYDTSRTTSKPIVVHFYNSTSAYREVVLWDTDIQMWRDKKMSVLVAGKTRFKDRNGNIIKTYTGSQLIQLSL